MTPQFVDALIAIGVYAHLAGCAYVVLAALRRWVR